MKLSFTDLIKCLHYQGLTQLAFVLEWFIRQATPHQLAALEVAICTWVKSSEEEN